MGSCAVDPEKRGWLTEEFAVAGEGEEIQEWPGVCWARGSGRCEQLHPGRGRVPTPPAPAWAFGVSQALSNDKTCLGNSHSQGC